MVLAAIVILGMSYFSDDISRDVADYQWFVEAADDESADSAVEIVTIDDVEDKMFY
jgi:hypothetical protein